MKFDVTFLEKTGSTNDECVKAAASLRHGSVIAAKSQESGRGRYGRRWESPPGNLYFSVFLRPARKEFSEISFLSALAVMRYLRIALPETEIKLKWPNDLLAGGRKIAGILLESSQGGGSGYAIAGIGVNIASFPSLPGVTGVVAEGGKIIDIYESLDLILAAFGEIFAAWEREGFAPIRREWLENAAFLEEKILVRLGSREIEGIFETINEEGGLVLRIGSGEREVISSGEVFPTI